MLINMFHVLALAYLTTGFLWPTLSIFLCFASRKCEHIHCTTAHAWRKYVRILSFLKLFTGHETRFSSPSPP